MNIPPSCRDRSCHRPTHSGFTLIELLVVISIIALLIGILLPALSAARSSARSIACLSNQRQLGISMATYTLDHEDQFVLYFGRGDTDFPNFWWPARMFKTGYIEVIDALLCPDFEDSVDSTYYDVTKNSSDNALNARLRRIHYGYNYRALGSGDLIGQTGVPNFFQHSPRVDTVMNPTETIMFADGVEASTIASGNLRGFAIVNNFPGTGGRADARHSDGDQVNVAWVDGHASTVGAADRFNPYGSDELTDITIDTNNLWDLD